MYEKEISMPTDPPPLASFPPAIQPWPFVSFFIPSALPGFWTWVCLFCSYNYVSLVLCGDWPINYSATFTTLWLSKYYFPQSQKQCSTPGEGNKILCQWTWVKWALFSYTPLNAQNHTTLYFLFSHFKKHTKRLFDYPPVLGNIHMIFFHQNYIHMASTLLGSSLCNKEIHSTANAQRNSYWAKQLSQ